MLTLTLSLCMNCLARPTRRVTGRRQHNANGVHKDNLRNLRKILEDFGSISGLKCNYDKTVVMPIGSVGESSFPLHGFCIANSVKLLGLNITNNPMDLPSKFCNLVDKISNTRAFWERFHLSLPGRIAVLKHS